MGGDGNGQIRHTLSMAATGSGGGSRLGDARLLLDVARSVSSSLDHDEIVDRTVRGLRRLVEFRTAWMEPAGTVKDEDREGLVVFPVEHEGDPMGTLCIEPSRSSGLSDEDRARVTALVPFVASALRHARALETGRRAVAELREAHGTKRDSVAIVSHELRTPLAVILGFATAIADNAERLEPERVRRLAERIIHSGHRLDRLVGDLLDLSRIERGTLRVETRPVDLRTFFDSMLPLTGDEMPAVDVVVEKDVPPVLADPHRLQQIIDNLLGNVRKFCGPAARAEISARRGGDRMVELRIADNGPGIEALALTRVFDPFFQGQKHATAGVGLGLYLVRELCSAMAARVEIDSAPGSGTRVIVTLRAVEEGRGRPHDTMSQSTEEET